MEFDHNKFVDDIVNWLLYKSPTRGELITVIYEVNDMLGQLNRQLSDVELGLLQKIVETEEYFEERHITLLCGIEEEYSVFNKEGEPIQDREALYRKLQNDICKSNDLITVYQNFATRIVERLGICRYIGSEPQLGTTENLGEIQTMVLTPLKAILAVSIAELCISYQLAKYNQEMPLGLHMARVTNHGNVSLYNEVLNEVLNREVNNIAVGLVDVSYKAIAMLTSPEEAEARKLVAHNAQKFGISADKNGTTVRLVKSDGRLEFRKCGAAGEDRRFDETTQQSIGISPLIAGIAVMCAGVKYGFNNDLHLQTYDEVIYDIKTNYDPHNSTGSISPALTKQRWQRLADDPVMRDFLGSDLLAQIVEAIKEQYAEWEIAPETGSWTAKVKQNDLAKDFKQAGI